ncbi:hypothetical protein PCE1_003996 [Barthelona sp. PCE]
MLVRTFVRFVSDHRANGAPKLARTNSTVKLPDDELHFTDVSSDDTLPDESFFHNFMSIYSNIIRVGEQSSIVCLENLQSFLKLIDNFTSFFPNQIKNVSACSMHKQSFIDLSTRNRHESSSRTALMTMSTDEFNPRSLLLDEDMCYLVEFSLGGKKKVRMLQIPSIDATQNGAFWFSYIKSLAMNEKPSYCHILDKIFNLLVDSIVFIAFVPNSIENRLTLMYLDSMKKYNGLFIGSPSKKSPIHSFFKKTTFDDENWDRIEELNQLKRVDNIERIFYDADVGIKDLETQFEKISPKVTKKSSPNIATVSPVSISRNTEERELLRTRVAFLESQLDDVHKKMAELSANIAKPPHRLPLPNFSPNVEVQTSTTTPLIQTPTQTDTMVHLQRETGTQTNLIMSEVGTPILAPEEIAPPSPVPAPSPLKEMRRKSKEDEHERITQAIDKFILTSSSEDVVDNAQFEKLIGHLDEIKERLGALESKAIPLSPPEVEKPPIPDDIKQSVISMESMTELAHVIKEAIVSAAPVTPEKKIVRTKDVSQRMVDTNTSPDTFFDVSAVDDDIYSGFETFSAPNPISKHNEAPLHVEDLAEPVRPATKVQEDVPRLSNSIQELKLRTSSLITEERTPSPKRKRRRKSPFSRLTRSPKSPTSLNVSPKRKSPLRSPNRRVITPRTKSKIIRQHEKLHQKPWY